MSRKGVLNQPITENVARIMGMQGKVREQSILNEVVNRYGDIVPGDMFDVFAEKDITVTGNSLGVTYLQTQKNEHNNSEDVDMTVRSLNIGL